MKDVLVVELVYACLAVQPVGLLLDASKEDQRLATQSLLSSIAVQDLGCLELTWHALLQRAMASLIMSPWRRSATQRVWI